MRWPKRLNCFRIDRLRLIALAAFLVVGQVFAPPVTRLHQAAAYSHARAPIGVSLPLVAEHRYRLLGKIRVLLFWVGSSNVGGARLTWHENADARALALLIGSDPQRAPRGISEWGYIREQVRGDTADVFGVRSLTNPGSLDDAEAKLAQGTGPQLFGAMCGIVSATEDRAVVTSVRVQRDITYRNFPRLLDAIDASGRWEPRHATRPPGAEPGFLTAVDRLLRASVTTARQGLELQRAVTSVSYVYKGSVYDVRLHDAEAIPETRIGAAIFRNLIRGEFTVRNRATGDTTDFTITYGSEGPLASVPVQASYQPHWWLKVELALDDELDVPTDPADDNAVLQQMDTTCETGQTKGAREVDEVAGQARFAPHR